VYSDIQKKIVNTWILYKNGYISSQLGTHSMSKSLNSPPTAQSQGIGLWWA
jgi:hypothetical protein